MKPPICSRYSLLALSRVTQKDLSIDGGTTTVRTVPSRLRITTSASSWPAASSADRQRPAPRLRRRISLMSLLRRSKSMACSGGSQPTMRRMCEGGVARIAVSGLVGRCQYSQCIAKAGCLSALMREIQREVNRPSRCRARRTTLLPDM